MTEKKETKKNSEPPITPKKNWFLLAFMEYKEGFLSGDLDKLSYFKPTKKVQDEENKK